MLNVFAVEGYFSLLVEMILLAVKIFAVVTCLMFSGQAYVAAGKLTKVAWGLSLGLGQVLKVRLLGYSPINLVKHGVPLAALGVSRDIRAARGSRW